MDIGILGGGISGLSLSLRLQDIGCNPTLFEKEEKVGGLCRTEIIDGYVFDLHGGHVFNSKFPYVKEWVFSLLPEKNWDFSVRKAMIHFEGKLIHYPFELSLSEISPEKACDCIIDFIKSNRESQYKPTNFLDWLYWMFGKSIAEYYMIPYNKKIWSSDLKEITTSWVDGKMPIATNKEILLAAITNLQEQKMPHATFYYPKYGGIQKLIDVMSAGIKNKITNYKADKIEKRGGFWYIDGQKFDHIISTIPLQELVNLYDGIDNTIRNMVMQLKCNSISTSLFKYPKGDISWIYYPSPAHSSHRTVLQGNLSKRIPGAITFEKTGKWSPKEQIVGHHVDMKDFISASFTKYAYPVFNHHYDNVIQTIRKYFKEKGIGLVGRFAEWKYYNMDICIKSSFDYIDQNILKKRHN